MKNRICFNENVFRLVLEGILNKQDLFMYLVLLRLHREQPNGATSDKRLSRLMHLNKCVVRAQRLRLEALGIVSFLPCRCRGADVFSIVIERDWNFGDFTHIPFSESIHAEEKLDKETVL